MAAKKLFLVKAEYRHGGGTLVLFEGREGQKLAEKCYDENLPTREHDMVTLYEGEQEDQGTYFYEIKYEEK